MLDLLSQREEALAAYRQVAGQDLQMRHDQCDLQLTKDYIQQRVETPFVRVENREED